MKDKEIAGCFFGILVLISIYCWHLYATKTYIEKTGVIEYKLDATYKSSSTYYIFRLIDDAETFDVEVSAKNYMKYNKGDTYTHHIITRENTLALVFACVLTLIYIIIAIIFFNE